MNEDEIAECRAGLVQMRWPAERSWLAQRIHTFLGHFFTADETENETVARIDDWIDAIGHLPEWAIDQAIRMRLQENSRRKPLPGEIIASCKLVMAPLKSIEQSLDIRAEHNLHKSVTKTARNTKKIAKGLADLAVAMRPPKALKSPTWKPEPGQDDGPGIIVELAEPSKALLKTPLVSGQKGR